MYSAASNKCIMICVAAEYLSSDEDGKPKLISSTLLSLIKGRSIDDNDKQYQIIDGKIFETSPGEMIHSTGSGRTYVLTKTNGYSGGSSEPRISYVTGSNSYFLPQKSYSESNQKETHSVPVSMLPSYKERDSTSYHTTSYDAHDVKSATRSVHIGSAPATGYVIRRESYPLYSLAKPVTSYIPSKKKPPVYPTFKTVSYEPDSGSKIYTSNEALPTQYISSYPSYSSSNNGLPGTYSIDPTSYPVSYTSESEPSGSYQTTYSRESNPNNGYPVVYSTDSKPASTYTTTYAGQSVPSSGAKRYVYLQDMNQTPTPVSSNLPLASYSGGTTQEVENHMPSTNTDTYNNYVPATGSYPADNSGGNEYKYDNNGNTYTTPQQNYAPVTNEESYNGGEKEYYVKNNYPSFSSLFEPGSISTFSNEETVHTNSDGKGKRKKRIKQQVIGVVGIMDARFSPNDLAQNMQSFLPGQGSTNFVNGPAASGYTGGFNNGPYGNTLQKQSNFAASPQNSPDPNFSPNTPEQNNLQPVSYDASMSGNNQPISPQSPPPQPPPSLSQGNLEQQPSSKKAENNGQMINFDQRLRTEEYNARHEAHMKHMSKTRDGIMAPGQNQNGNNQYATQTTSIESQQGTVYTVHGAGQTQDQHPPPAQQLQYTDQMAQEAPAAYGPVSSSSENIYVQERLHNPHPGLHRGPINPLSPPENLQNHPANLPNPPPHHLNHLQRNHPQTIMHHQTIQHTHQPNQVIHQANHQHTQQINQPIPLIAQNQQLNQNR